MMLRKFVIHLSGKSCSGKSSVAKILSDRLPSIYTIAYDKLKRQLAGYHRDKHAHLIKNLTLGFFEVVCKENISVLLLSGFKNKTEYLQYREITEKYGYTFVFIELTAPMDILLHRFRERVENAKREGGKLSVTDEGLFLENASKDWFVPKGAVSFDTSKTAPEIIADQIIGLLQSSKSIQE
ncbi:MAG: AAA family ATPase [Patescibacteria group bacterium]